MEGSKDTVSDNSKEKAGKYDILEGKSLKGGKISLYDVGRCASDAEDLGNVNTTVPPFSKPLNPDM